MAIYSCVLFIITLLPVCSLTSSVPEYTRGVSIGNLPDDDEALCGLVSSHDYVDRIYAISGARVLALDKESAHIQMTIQANSKENNTGVAWKAIAVGSCGESRLRSCVYLAKSFHKGVELLRFREPDDAEGVFDVSTQDHMSVILPKLTANQENLFILVDREGNVVILRSESESSSYYGYKVVASDWVIKKSSTNDISLSKTKMVMQQEMVLKSVNWDQDSNKVLIQSNNNEVFAMSGRLHQPLLEVLEGKPHHVKLRLPKGHMLGYICWDTSINSIYSSTTGEKNSLLKFERVTQSSLDYQNDGSGSNGSSRSRYQGCSDKNRRCSTWAKNKMCMKRRSYMVEYCPEACNLCSNTTGENERLRDRPLPCADGNHMCVVWAEQGGCEKGASREYLLQNCKVSCKVCPGENSPTARCQDMHKYCPSWASAGRCTSRPEYMNKDCAASCNTCPTSDKYIQNDEASSSSSSTVCKDHSKYCSAWAKKGKCDSRKDFMLMKCPYSCGRCGGQSSATDHLQSEIKCEDKSEYCLLWEAQGYCKAKAGYMSVNCRSACKLCQRRQQNLSYRNSASECEDAANFCPTWAKYKMCTLKPAYMKENCAKSCGKCGQIGIESDTSNRILKADDDGLRGTSHEPDTSAPVRERASLPVRERTTLQTSCMDKRTDCSKYVEGGYCSRRQDYMSVYCKRSCNMCGGEESAHSLSAAATSPSTTQDQLIEQTATTPCRDTRNHCKAWATSGLCKSRPDAMNSVCPLSCQVCKGKSGKSINTQITVSPPRTAQTATVKPAEREKPENCEDKSGLCSLWKTVGHCDSNTRTMKAYCAKTCGLCADSQPKPTQSSCEDRNKFCASYAKSNRCQVYVGYMRTNCAKSCNMCDSSSSANSPSRSSDVVDCDDKNSFCTRWASKGYCGLRKDFMGKMCRKSCGLCR